MKHFGTNFSETAKALNSKVNLGTNKQSSIDRKQAIARIYISVVLLIISVFLIIKKDILGGESSKDVGQTILGGILGYWLK